MNAETQRRLILEQFTRQAVPFKEFPAHSNESSLEHVLRASAVQPTDAVLDVACGPGLVATAFAKFAQHVTGIDLTPAMIEQARELQASRGLTNVDWRVGDVTALPFEDAAFDLVFTRYSFHHMLEPRRVLDEMVRVGKPGGRVVVVDVYSRDPEQGEAYDRVETLRDPSHVRALGLGEFADLFRDAGLVDVEVGFYGLEVVLEDLLAGCFPNPGDDDKVRQIFADDIGHDRLGVGAYRKDGQIRFSFPIVVLVGRKPE
ncbi:class I SAM-dependent methyltransferase [Singulisphaera sp. PoT]|uniref:class I SAM-dependent methyltransferase n=1 Tax=Singulisphaera sp. PoT TaxID=3411797 RepID=UPI003BF49B4F